jgi:hypothetical protein
VHATGGRALGTAEPRAHEHVAGLAGLESSSRTEASRSRSSASPPSSGADTSRERDGRQRRIAAMCAERCERRTDLSLVRLDASQHRSTIKQSTMRSSFLTASMRTALTTAFLPRGTSAGELSERASIPVT